MTKLALALALALGLSACDRDGARGGADSPEALVRVYIDAIARQDHRAVVELFHPQFRSEVRAALDRTPRAALETRAQDLTRALARETSFEEVNPDSVPLAWGDQVRRLRYSCGPSARPCSAGFIHLEGRWYIIEVE